MSTLHHVSKQPRFATMPAVTIIGMESLSSQRNNRIPALWDAFLPRRDAIKNVADATLAYGYCISHDEMESTECEDDEFTALVGLAVTKIEDVPEGMVVRTFKEVECAVFTHRGKFNPTGLSKTYGHVYGEWLPSSGYELAENWHLELYGEKFRGTDHDETEIEIYLPIRKR